MKKVLFSFLILLVSTQSLLAQNWIWAKQGICTTSNGVIDPEGMATDNFGRIYETGTYRYTVVLGSDTLKNGGANGNVFLVKYDINGNVLWARNSTLTTSSSSGATTVKADNLGNVYIGGTTNAPIIFGMDTVKGPEGFLVKYDAMGNVLWADSVSSYVSGIAIDAANDVYLSTMEGTSNSSADLIKYAPNGRLKWIKRSSSPGGYAKGNGVSTDNFGNVYITGDFNTELIYGLDTTKTIGWLTDVFLAKYDTSGNILWLKSGAVPSKLNYSDSYSVATDNSGNAYITGEFFDTIAFDSYNFTNGPHGNVFLTKYAPNGTVLWAQSGQLPPIVGGNRALGYSVCTDYWNNVYLSGTFEDTMSMGGGTISIGNISWEGYDPSFLIKFDSTGHAMCSAAINNDNDDYNGVVADPLGDNVYFGGDAFYTVLCAIGNDTLKSSGTEYSFLAKWTCSACNITPTIAGPTNTCSGQGTTLVASGGKTYYWSNGAKTDSITVAPTVTTTYNVAISNDSCKGVSSFTVNVKPLPKLTIGIAKDTPCVNSTIDGLTGSPAGGIFSGLGVSGTNFNPKTAGLGTHFITYTYTDVDGCTNTDSIKVLVSSCTGISEAAQGNEIHIYPNPNNGQVIVQLQTLRDKESIEVYSMIGTKIYSSILSSLTTIIDLDNEPKGLYLYRVVTESGSLVFEGNLVIQ